MNFDLNDEQRMLKESIDSVIADQYSFEQRRQHAQDSRGWSRTMWSQFAELGLLALPFAEADGGFDGGPVERMIVAEAFGRGLVLEPYFATVILAGSALRFGASDAQRARWVSQVTDGSLLLAFAHGEVDARYDLAHVATTAVRDGDDWLISGRKAVVWHGDCADKLIVSARVSGDTASPDGIALFMVDSDAAGLTRAPYRTHDGLRAADIGLDQVRVGSDSLIGSAGGAYPIIERVSHEAIAFMAAEAVGAMEAALNITVEYLKTRQQFGVVLSSFQALQHRCAEMFVATEQARSIAIFAAMRVDDDNALERTRAMAATKVQVGKSASFVGKQAIQVHGGIGVTEEYVIGHYFKRLTVMETIFGDTDHHLAALARAGGLIGTERE